MNTTRKAPKGLPPSVLTEAGMATLANEMHPLKASSSMLVTDVGMATVANELHPRKAAYSMLVTPRNGNAC